MTESPATPPMTAGLAGMAARWAALAEPERRLREAVIAEARSWCRPPTPFVHQGRIKGVAVDCVGLVVAAGEAAGVLPLDPTAERRFAGYGRSPSPRRMREALELGMVEIPADVVLPGDVAWLAWREDLPMHLAILAIGSGGARIVHALAEAFTGEFPGGRAVEHGLAAEWPRRVDSWWRYPGLAGAMGAVLPGTKEGAR